MGAINRVTGMTATAITVAAVITAADAMTIAGMAKAVRSIIRRCALVLKQGEEQHVDPAQPAVDQHPQNGFVGVVGQHHRGDGPIAEAIANEGRTYDAKSAFDN